MIRRHLWVVGALAVAFSLGAKTQQVVEMVDYCKANNGYMEIHFLQPVCMLRRSK